MNKWLFGIALVAPAIVALLGAWLLARGAARQDTDQIDPRRFR